MKSLILPLTLTLASSLAFAAPPARKAEPNAQGVARSTSVRSEEATENASRPKMVRHHATKNVRRTSQHRARKHSTDTSVRAQSSMKY